MTTATGFHVFFANEQPTTDQVNGWVGEQVIARDTYSNLTGIASPPTGLHGWATDKKIMIRYSGSAWVNADVPVFAKANLPTSVPTNSVAYCFDAATMAVTADGTNWAALGVTSCTNATRPTAAFLNQVIVETDTGRTYVCTNVTGPTWTAREVSVKTSSTAPSSPVAGDVWVDSDDSTVWVYDGANFCPVAGATVGTARPTNKIVGTVFRNTSSAVTELWDGTNWVTVGASSALTFHSGGTAGTGSTNYFCYSLSATEAEKQIPIPFACTLSNMHVTLSGTPGSGKSYALTVRKNAADTALTCTVADTATTASDTTHSVAFAAGDLITISANPSGTPTGRQVGVSLRVVAS